jgi:hypothetical protein
MTQRDLAEINWKAAFVGFGVDLAFTELVGGIVVAVVLALKGITLEGDAAIPADVELVFRSIGVLGAFVGGAVAGYIARQRGMLHGVLASVIGLLIVLCALPMFGGQVVGIRDLGFIVLNLVAAGYGGGAGERWHARREGRGGGGG